MKLIRQGCALSALLVGVVSALIPISAGALPLLQLYVEGATYDDTHESWVFEPSGSDPIRLWVIGNVAGSGGAAAVQRR